MVCLSRVAKGVDERNKRMLSELIIADRAIFEAHFGDDTFSIPTTLLPGNLREVLVPHELREHISVQDIQGSMIGHTGMMVHISSHLLSHPFTFGRTNSPYDLSHQWMSPTHIRVAFAAYKSRQQRRLWIGGSHSY